MWYRDFANLYRFQAATLLADHFVTPYPVARAMVEACRAAYALGDKGLEYTPPLATRDAADLVKDAWLDGVQRKDRIVVKLTSRECQEWFTGQADDHSNCEGCGGTGKDPCVFASVEDPFASFWADNDQSLGGSSWEDDGESFAYAMPGDHPGLVAELRAEGYRLDLSEYETHD